MRSHFRAKLIPIFVTSICLSVCLTPVAFAASNSCSEQFAETREITRQQRLQFYNPFNLFEGRTVNAIELLGQDFYAPSEKGAVVGISGYSGFRAKLNQANADFLTGKPFADGKRVLHFDLKDPDALIDVLRQAYRTAGPIYRLAIMGHGSPGSIEIGSGKLNTLGRFWMWSNKKQLRKLPSDLFVKDAEIVILSCNCARGNIVNADGGIDKIKKVFSKFVRNGAKIIASRQTILGNTEGFEETEIVSRIRSEDRSTSIVAKILIAPLALVILPTMWVGNIVKMAWLDEKSKFEPIVVIDLPPVDRNGN